MTSCKRTDCKYRNPKLIKTWDVNGCNYILITGKSKIAQMPKGEKYDIETCPYYEKGKAKRRSIVNPTDFADNREAIGDVNLLKSNGCASTMYDMGYGDNDIAQVMNVELSSVARWRNVEMVGRQNKPRRQIEWDGVGEMLKKGYSTSAVAQFFSINEYVVEMYKEARERK